MFSKPVAIVVLFGASVVASERDEWRAIYQAGEKIGYQRTKFSRDANERWVTKRERHLKSGNIKLDQTEIIRSRDDGFVERYELREGGRVFVTKFLASDGAVTATTTRDLRDSQWQAPAAIRSPVWFQRQLRQNIMPPRTRMRFTSAISPTESRKLVITSGNSRTISLPNGDRKKLLPLTIESTPPYERNTWYMNERGQIELSEFSYRAMKFQLLQVSREQAQPPEAAREFDIALTSFVSANRKLTDGRGAELAVYRVSGRPELQELLDHPPRQTAIAADDGSVEVTVRATKLEPGERHRRVDRKYLASTKLIDHRTIAVNQYALEAAGGEFDPAIIATKLQRAVGRLVRNRAFASTTPAASEILKQKQGDCTEHAVLLTALLRARRVPARLATGLLYIDGKKGFTTHVWTEAMINGRWTALDATFARRRDSKQPARTPGAGYLQISHSHLPDGEAVVDLLEPLADLVPQISIEISSDE